MPNLVIPNIDFEELEKHRKVIDKLLYESKVTTKRYRGYYKISAEHEEALEGILNMLDFWSDAQLEKEN